ncbi:pilus assembly FimT family protein [Pyxidicoccus xibeiensis]|uniref:pilus assembly FimT family protein n=1 Tax=Pyxidicoccus xibeiensis TaxID=2906759 RepID=UPI0020A795DB|nr:prepilin-type N-terminal cleavage/methylation domain-containing protein [Pyxidicoccus xibeiensis]MCP3138953.1 prepilin-type N-terminal cleavage/methylation domain-containing protein [Pyxidicoccus xibeiensis]
MSRRSERGLTMLELSVVLAIIGVLAALSFATYERLSVRTGPQNAAADLSGALSEARARAVDRQAEVWLIIYPDIDDQGVAGQGSGGWFLVEDRRRDFGSTSAPPAGHLRYATFTPPGAVEPSPDQGSLVDAIYMDDYTRRSVRFGSTGQLVWDGVFAGLAPSACSFCTGTPRRGAIVFREDGSARLVDGAGTTFVPTGAGAVQRAGSLGLVSSDGQHEFLFAVSGPAGFVDSRSR